jgi:hypothetical protein
MAARFIPIAVPLILSALAACASNSPSQPATATSATVHRTGSWISVADTPCKDADPAAGTSPMQTVCQQDLENTGHPDMASALKGLVPAAR